MLGRIYRYDELSNDGGESAIRPAIVFAKHIEMSELCNNSACFSAEIKGRLLAADSKRIYGVADFGIDGTVDFPHDSGA